MRWLIDDSSRETVVFMQHNKSHTQWCLCTFSKLQKGGIANERSHKREQRSPI